MGFVCSPLSALRRSVALHSVDSAAVSFLASGRIHSVPGSVALPAFAGSHGFRSAWLATGIHSLTPSSQENEFLSLAFAPLEFLVAFPLHPCRRSGPASEQLCDDIAASALLPRCLARAAASAVGRCDRRMRFIVRPARPPAACLREGASNSCLVSGSPSGAPPPAAPGSGSRPRRPPLQGRSRFRLGGSFLFRFVFRFLQRRLVKH